MYLIVGGVFFFVLLRVERNKTLDYETPWGLESYF